jgi:cysteinyl-tRNA synthetase
MSVKALGPTFDIHGGGMDLIFPHHENEIAQSEACTERPFARYWIHNGFVNINQEKMSKSLGNFFTIREIFEKFPYSNDVTAEIMRYFLLSTHYRSPVDFSDAALWEAKSALDNFYTLFQKLEESEDRDDGGEVEDVLATFSSRFEAAMDDDFNTAAALAEFQRLRSDINRLNPERFSSELAMNVRKTFTSLGEVLGLFAVKDWRFTVASEATLPAESISREEEIKSLIAVREQARRDRNWKRSDEIREELKQMGVILEDRPDGSTRVKR